MAYIYKITNKINNKIFIGQTSRDIDTRFDEHCSENIIVSKLHSDIKEFGWRNFYIEEIEEVPIEKLDEREKYWITKFNSNNPDIGYNKLIDYDNLTYGTKVLVVENGIVFNSIEECVDCICKTTSWNFNSVNSYLRIIINGCYSFCSYHFRFVDVPDDLLDDMDTKIDWVKTLNIRYNNTCIYCLELNMEFDTAGQAAKYCVDNNWYHYSGEHSVSIALSLISNYVKNPSEDGIEKINNFHFYKIPSVERDDKSVYCKELDLTFNSIEDCAKYFTCNNIWEGIKLKTAKNRISDILDGVFKDYSGYSFMYPEEGNNV